MRHRAASAHILPYDEMLSTLLSVMLLAFAPSQSSVTELGHAPQGFVAHAPNARGQKYDTVTVVLVDALPAFNVSAVNASYDAIVRRSSALNTHDTILLLRAHADGAILDAAMQAVTLSRAAHGTHPQTLHGRQFGVMTLGVKRPLTRSASRGDYIRLAQRIVDRLGSASLKDVVGVGRVPALDVLLPSRQ
jgi:hypothetical protein